MRAVTHLTLETHNHIFDVSVDLRFIVTAFGRGALRLCLTGGEGHYHRRTSTATSSASARVVVTAALVRAHSAATVSLKLTTIIGMGSAHPTGIMKRVGFTVGVTTLPKS